MNIRASILLAAFAGSLIPAQSAIVYPNFNSTAGLQLNGAAHQDTYNASGVLRLTDDLDESGSAFSTSAVTLTGASFSTFFSFVMSDPIGIGDGDGQGADGIVFVVQTVSNTAGGAGGGIGYQNLANSVGIEFDTYHNGDLGDPDGNHLGIDLGGNIVSVATTSIGPRFNDGSEWFSWVDYDGDTDLLEVRVSQTATRPTLANLAYTVDLETVLGNPNAYVGFTSGTGAGGNDHDIIQWQFNAEYDPIEHGVVPEPTTVIGGAALGLLAASRLLRRSRKS